MIETFPPDSEFILQDTRTKRWAIPYHYEALNARVENLLIRQKQAIWDKRILDLGCHFGSFAYAALQHGARDVCGVDSEAVLLQKGRTLFTQHKISKKRYRFIQKEIMWFLEKAKSKSVDTILCLGVFYYLPDPVQALHAMARIARQYIILDTFTAYYAAAMAEMRDAVLTKTKPETFELPLVIHTLTQSQKKDYHLKTNTKNAQGKALSLLALPTVAALEMFFRVAGLQAEEILWQAYSQHPQVQWQDFHGSEAKQQAHWADVYQAKLRVSYCLKI